MNAISMNAEQETQIAEESPRTTVLFGRFMLPDMSEHPCQVGDINAEGVSLLTSTDVEAGTQIIAYLEDIGRVDGKLDQKIDGGFHIAFELTGARRERMEKRLEWHRDTTATERRHDRFSPKEAASKLTLADGREYDCEVVDISISGAAVKTHVLPSIGTYVSLGKMRGRVVRYTDDGVGIEFLRQMDRDKLAQHAHT